MPLVVPGGLQQTSRTREKTTVSDSVVPRVVPLAAKTDELSDDEWSLLASFRSLGDEDKLRLLRFIEGLKEV